MTVENVQRRYNLELTKRYSDAVAEIELRNDTVSRQAFWAMVRGINEAARLLGLPEFEVPMVDARTDHEVVGAYYVDRILAAGDPGEELTL